MKGKGKQKNIGGGDNLDNLMNAFGDDQMNAGFDKFEKNFNPEKEFDMPIYNNIDSQFDDFSKMLGGGDIDLTLNENKESEDDKLLKAILGNVPIKKKKDDMAELSNALKMAEVNLKKKQGGTSEADILKGILGGNTGGKNKKDDDGMDELNSILSMADKNLKNKDKNDMALVSKFLTKEEINNESGEKEEVKKEPKKEIKNENNINNNIEDKYPLQQEKIFHRINQMKSLAVLEKEISVCNLVINYKKKNNLDYKEWENKIEQANKQLNDIKAKRQSGEMDLSTYIKTISDEVSYEQKLLDVYLAKDKTSTPNQLENIKKRINIRILTIQKEIKDSKEEEEEQDKDEEEQEQEELNNNNKIKEEPKKEELNIIKKEEPKKERNPDEEKARYIDLLLQQYLSARNYFKENELKEQEKDCIDKCKSIIIAKKQIQLGNIDTIDLNSLPKPIKPEYIFGHSLAEREEKFNEIIAELEKQKEEIVQKKATYNEKLGALKKRELEKMKDQIKQVRDNFDSKINKFDEDIEQMKEKLKDKWTPVPAYCNLPQEEKVEKINKDIPEYTMRVHIGKTDYEKDNIYLKVKLNLGEKEMNKEVKLKKAKLFDETWDWTFDKKEYKSLHRKSIEVQMEKTHWIKIGGADVKGSLKVDLKNLKDSNSIGGNYKIEIQSKKTSANIEIKIDLRYPFVDKQYETVTKEVFTIQKIFPPFNPKSAELPGGPTIVPPKKNNKIVENKIETEEKQEEKEEEEEKEEKEEEKEERKEIPKKEETKEIPKKEEAKEIPKKEEKKAEQKVERSNFPEEELKDIDGVDYLNSLAVLEHKLKVLEEQIAKISGRTPKELLQKKVKMSCKIKLMKQSFENGDVSPKDYLTLLNEQMVHERQLFDLFKQEKDIQNARIVVERIKIMRKEMEELKELIKNNK